MSKNYIIKNRLWPWMLLRPVPATALACAPFVGGPLDADKVTHVYMRTLNDQLLKLQEQRSMITKWSPSQVLDINSDHLPFLLEPAYSLWQSGSTSCFNQLIFMPCWYHALWKIVLDFDCIYDLICIWLEGAS